jgi:hypothetical protein
VVLLGAIASLAVTIACTDPGNPPVTTTTTSPPTTSPPTTAPGHGDHGGSEAPYTSPDDPRLTPDQQARAKDLIARTEVGMQRFPNELSLILDGYQSIRDGDSGYEHYIKWSLLADGRVLDADAIEAVVLEVRPGQPKRVVAAMYFAEAGTPLDRVPDIAGPLTVWHNHKDLCWDATGRVVQGVFRLGRCIPWGTVRPLDPMIHVFVTEQRCGPFAEVDDMNGIIDRWLRSTGQMPPRPADTGCAHVHGGDHS